MKYILLPIHPEWCCKFISRDKKTEVRRWTTLYNAINRLIKEQGKAPCLIYCTKGKDLLLAYEEYDQSSMSYYGTQYALITRNPYIDNRKPPKEDDEDYSLYKAYREMYRYYSKELKEEEGGHERILNGKVIAEFEASAEVIYPKEELGAEMLGCFPEIIDINYKTDTLGASELLKRSCLTDEQIADYLTDNDANSPILGTAIHVHGLKIFDKPKELKEFYQSFRCKKHEWKFANNNVEIDPQTKALRQPIRHGYEYSYPLTHAPQSWCYVEAEE